MHSVPMSVTRSPLFARLALGALVVIGTACSSGESAPPAGNAAGGRPGGGGPGGGGPGGGGPRGGRFGGPGGGRGGPTAVEIATISTGALARQSMVSGALEPVRTVGVNAQMSGALTAVNVQEGSAVRSGQVLAQVDAREVAAQVRSAVAALEFARSTAGRSEQLYTDRVITAVEYERDRAALSAAQAAYDGLRTRLGYASVRAPISGVVTEKTVEAGDVVQGQSRLFTIADVSTLVARVNVSELEVAGIREGDMAEVTVDALNGARFQARVRRVFPAADTTTRMVPVEVALGGSAARLLKPGFLARVTFKLGERTGVTLAPAGAVVGTAQNRAVFVVKGDKVERRPVRVGSASGERVEVLEGVVPGDTVVVAGVDQVRDGGAIRIVQPMGAQRDARRATTMKAGARQ